MTDTTTEERIARIATGVGFLIMAHEDDSPMVKDLIFLLAEVKRLRREISASKQDPDRPLSAETFDWSVLVRLDRLEAAEFEIQRLNDKLKEKPYATR